MQLLTRKLRLHVQCIHLNERRGPDNDGGDGDDDDNGDHVDGDLYIIGAVSIK